MKLNCDYIFQNCLICDNNKAASEAISSAMILPGRIYNPLFIYCAIGVGKTHLLQAIAHKYKPDSKIYYFTIEQFVNDITQAIQNHRYIDFIGYCMNLNVLLIDDIHLIRNKNSIAQELLHIFERLHKARKQIIITADRLPKEIFNAKNKAVEIFQKGLVVKIAPPAYSDRLRFLQTKAQNAGLSLSNDIFEDLARKAHPDFRELEGFLAKIKFSSFCPRVSK